MFDIFVTFFSAYEDEVGFLQVNPAKIASSYLQGWFPIDSVSW